MRKYALLLLAMAAAPATAQAGGSGPQIPGQPDITVRAPERVVCRPVVRTATRMRAARQCRTVTQWASVETARSDDERIEESADRLDALGADDISTNDQGGMQSCMDTPLGPR